MSCCPTSHPSASHISKKLKLVRHQSIIALTPSSPKLLSIEPILVKNPGRFVFFPIQDDTTLAM
jgi:hypothetical protein